MTVPDTIVPPSDFFLETNLPFLPWNQSYWKHDNEAMWFEPRILPNMVTILNTYLMNRFCGLKIKTNLKGDMPPLPAEEGVV